MKVHAYLAMVAGFTLLLIGCTTDIVVDRPITAGDDTSLTPTVDTERVALEIVQSSGWMLDEDIAPPAEAERDALPIFLGGDRQQIAGDIYHYSWNLRVGAGPFDVIKLHRVVRERAPYRPIRSRDSVFMLHGDFKTFDGCFMPGYLSPLHADDFGIAPYLAADDVDVWGMDQAHNSIEAGESDFTSMADWDMYKYVDDTRRGMAIARIIRRLTGNGFQKMNLLGYSGGAALGFAVVNEEAGLHRNWRHVNGFIPVDQGMFSADPDWAASDCATAQYYASLTDAGEYVEVNPLPLFGAPARDDPDGPSELIPGFTNWQAALALAVYPYTEGLPYHFLAGEFDEFGLPTGLQYTDVDLWIDFMIQAPPFFANAFSRDEYISLCGEAVAPWTDDLGAVNLPVLYVSAAGGFGLQYEVTLDRMTSADVSQLVVSLHPPEEIALDFAHVDLFIADNAPALVWQPILDWVSNRGMVAGEAAPLVAVDAR